MASTVTEHLETLRGLLRGHRDPILRANGLNSAQYAALAQLTDGATRTCGELAGRIGVRHQGMQMTLDRLERKGLVERPGPVGPGFARRASLTRRGCEIVERCSAAFVQTEHWMLARFDAELADTFVQCLEECADRLRKWPRPAAPSARSSGARPARPEDIASHAATCPVCHVIAKRR